MTILILAGLFNSILLLKEATKRGKKWLVIEKRDHWWKLSYTIAKISKASMCINMVL